MSRLYALVFVLLCCAGCTDAQKAQWKEAFSDARGDNMQMKGFGN